MYCALLREHDIEPLLDGEYSGPVTLGLYTTATPLLIQVSDEDEAAALEVLDALIRERRGEVVFESAPDNPMAVGAPEAASSPPSRRWSYAAVLLLLVPVPVLLIFALQALLTGRAQQALPLLLLGAALAAPPILAHFLARPSKPPPRP